MIQDTCYENQTDKKTTQLADEPNGRAQAGQEVPWNVLLVITLQGS
jgi:hypothetical protein